VDFSVKRDSQKAKENQMFVKGKRLPRQGGKENGLRGGRPSKGQQEIKRLTAELALKYLEDRLRPVMDTYFSLATGRRSGRMRLKLDPATCRHYVERFISAAPKTVNLTTQKTAEEFYDELEKELKAECEAKAQLENKTTNSGKADDGDPPDGETVH
jgi:hypothetical protein